MAGACAHFVARFAHLGDSGTARRLPRQLGNSGRAPSVPTCLAAGPASALRTGGESMSIRHARSVLRAFLAVSAVAGFAGLAAADTVIGLRDGNEIVWFDAATPGNVVAVDVTGLEPGESLVGIDV